MSTGVGPGLQSPCGAWTRPGWVRFPHVPAILAALLAAAGGVGVPDPAAGQEPAPSARDTHPAEEAGAAVTPAVEPVQEAPADTTPPVTPLGALARSMVLPGWGQSAVGRPARGAVYFTLETVSLFMVFKTQAKLAAARRAEPPDEGLVDSRTAQRENWIVLSVFWAFLSGLDAWVSTHLWDFEPEVTPPADGSAGIEVRYDVPVAFP